MGNTPQTEAKSIFTSKTFWANFISVVVSVGAAFGIPLPLTPEEQATLVGVIMGIINIGLRFVTTKPVSIKGTKASN